MLTLLSPIASTRELVKERGVGVNRNAVML